MRIEIPLKLGHIWIGPYPPPWHWMNTWRAKHPNWEYTLYDNQFLATYNFRTRHLIDEYLKRQQYAGVADLMRYEILYEYGGLIQAADSICYHNTDELWTKACPYTIYENEFIRGSLVSPVLAAPPQNEFVGALVEELCKLGKEDLDIPWRTTGNLFVAQMIAKLKPEITIFPSHYFIPVHFEGMVYDGKDKVYAKQLFGSTQKSYHKAKKLPPLKRLMAKFTKRTNIKKYAEEAEKRFKDKRKALFDLDFDN